jgi:hypothetical protein
MTLPCDGPSATMMIMLTYMGVELIMTRTLPLSADGSSQVI